MLAILVCHHLDFVSVLVGVSAGTAPVVAAKRRLLAGAFLCKSITSSRLIAMQRNYARRLIQATIDVTDAISIIVSTDLFEALTGAARNLRQ